MAASIDLLSPSDPAPSSTVSLYDYLKKSNFRIWAKFTRSFNPRDSPDYEKYIQEILDADADYKAYLNYSIGDEPQQ